MKWVGPAAVSLLLIPAAAAAHGGASSGPAFETNDIIIAATIGAVLVLFAVGWSRMPMRRSGGTVIPRWRALLFVTGLATLAAALLPPLDRLADAHFSAHMAQHLILLVVAPPMLAASQAQLVMLRAFPLPTRRAIGRWFSQCPGARQFAHHSGTVWFVCLSSVAVLWFWHLPQNYDWARRNEIVHDTEHFLFLFTETAFWRVVLFSGTRRLGRMAAALIIAMMGIQGGLLAAIITLASTPLYQTYGVSAGTLADQALGGVMMWVLASIVYLAAFVLTLGLALTGRENRYGRGEHMSELRAIRTER